MIKCEKKLDNGLFSGALALTISVFTVKLIGYLYKLPLSHVLGDEGMGYFNSAYSIFSFFYMLSLGGVPRAVAVCVADSRYRYGMESARKILNICLKIFLTIGIIFASCLMMFSGFFSKIIGNSAARLSLFCIAPSLTFVSAAGVLRGYLNGLGRLREVAVAEVLDGVSKFVTGLSLALFATSKNESAYIVSAYTVLGVSIGAFIGALFMLICAKIKNTDDNNRQKCEFLENSIKSTTESKKEILKKIFKISAPITLSAAVMGATNIIDLGMIMKRLLSVGFSEVEAVALYGNFTTLVIPLLNLASAFVTPFATAAMPYIAKHNALRNESEYYNLIEQIISLTAVCICPVAMAYFFFADEILALLFSDSSALIASPLLTFASPSVLFSALLVMMNTVLEASGHVRVPLISMSVGATVKIISSYILIGRFGIYGAPVSTVLCYFTAILISALALKKRVKPKRSVLSISLLPFVLSALIILLARAVYNLIPIGGENIWIFIPFTMAVALIYIGFVWIFMRKRVGFLTKYVKIAKK